MSLAEAARSTVSTLSALSCSVSVPGMGGRLSQSTPWPPCTVITQVMVPPPLHHGAHPAAQQRPAPHPGVAPRGLAAVGVEVAELVRLLYLRPGHVLHTQLLHSPRYSVSLHAVV